MTTFTRRAGVAAAVLLTLAACGGGEVTNEEAIDALAATFADGDDTLDLSDEQVRCISTDVVEGVGAERALEIEGTDLDGNLPLADAEQVTDAFLGCIDTKEFFRGIVSENPTSETVPPAFVDCLVDQLDGDVLRSVFIAEFSGQGDTDALGEAFGAEAGVACISVLTPEELEQLAES